MKIAIPTFATRVSPRFDCAQDVLVVTIETGGVPERQELRASDWTPLERINRLLDLNVDTVLCGGIDCRSVESFQAAGVTVYSWVSGEIEDAMTALLRGDLDFQATRQGGGRCRCRRFVGSIGPQGRDPGSGLGMQGRGRHGGRDGDANGGGKAGRSRNGRRPKTRDPLAW